MDKIYEIRQNLIEFYYKNEVYLAPVLKGLTMLLILLVMNAQIGYNTDITSWNIVLIAVLVAALLPWGAMTGFSALFLLLHLYSLSWEVAAVTAAMLFIAAIMQYIFLPRYGLAIVLVPVLFFLKIPYAVPLVVGLLGGITAFIPCGVGAFLYYFIVGVQKNADIFMRTSGEGASTLERFPQIFSIIKDNKLMLISVIAFAVAALIVYSLKKLSTDYAPYIALAAGTIIIIAIYLIGGFTSDATVPYLEVFLGSVIGFIIASLFSFIGVAMDYNHTEYLQYDDDEYSYYVRAVPKIRISTKTVKIQDITSDDIDEDEIKQALDALSEFDSNERT